MTLPHCYHLSLPSPAVYELDDEQPCYRQILPSKGERATMLSMAPLAGLWGMRFRLKLLEACALTLHLLLQAMAWRWNRSCRLKTKHSHRLLHGRFLSPHCRCLTLLVALLVGVDGPPWTTPGCDLFHRRESLVLPTCFLLHLLPYSPANAGGHQAAHCRC